MKIVVYGLWHLGCVTAACLAKIGHQVVGLDLDREVIKGLSANVPPLHEPGLAELIAAEQTKGTIRFTTDASDALHDADLVWVTFDTPVDENDVADIAYVRDRLEEIVDAIEPGTIVLVSSQVPAGFTRGLAGDWQGREIRFAYSPENLRLGKAIDVFLKPERIIVGLENRDDQAEIAEMLAPITANIEWMSLESAEMTKHALNAFLATSVTFINELARICEAVGADAKEVERGLKSEGRIGPKAYLAPGVAYAGGTLARDVAFLTAFGNRHSVAVPLMQGIAASNQAHKNWLREKCSALLAGVSQPQVAILGLTYKPGTDTLRRSGAIELCKWLHGHGVAIRAFDPALKALPDELTSMIDLRANSSEALAGTDLAIVATEWPEFRSLVPDSFVAVMRAPQVIDQNHFLAAQLAADDRIRYVATGKVTGSAIAFDAGTSPTPRPHLRRSTAGRSATT